MTVSSEVSSVSYNGNGSTQIFAVPYYFLADSHLRVILRAADGTETVQAITTNYTVSVAGNQAGGQVTMLVAPATGVTLVILRNVPATQETDYVANDPFPAESHERALDKLTMLVQQGVFEYGRALRVPDSDPEPQRLPPAAQRSGRLLSFDSQGQPVVVAPAAGSATELAIMLANDADPNEGAAMIGGLIANNLTINVPADFATPSLAMDYLRGYTIARGAYVTIKVADGTYPGNINANHPQGGQIRIIGNESNPAACVIMGTNPASYSGITVDKGHQLGYLNGFKFDLPAKAEQPYNYTGILALTGGVIICGPNIQVNNWYYGIAAHTGAFIKCDYAQVTNSGDVGIWAFVGSTVECNYASSNNASDATNPWGFGFQAEFGSAMICTGATASGNKIGGIAALSNSLVRAHSTTCNANVGSGYVARLGSVIEAVGGVSSGNSGYGVSIEDGGYVVYLATNSGNTLGSVNAFSFLGEAGGQARVASSTGPLRLDTSGASPVYFNTSGGLQFEVVHVPSVANHLYVRGAAAGKPAEMGVFGSDANVDLMLLPKGTGKVRFGATQAIPGGFAENSIIEIKAADGAILQIACKRL